MCIFRPEYLPYLSFGAFVLMVFLWAEWEGRIRPMFIPRTEIERMARELIEQHADRAEEFAAVEEDRAWRYSENFQQGKWRRVRKELQRRRI